MTGSMSQQLELIATSSSNERKNCMYKDKEKKHAYIRLEIIISF